MRLRLHTALAVSCCVSACSVDDDPSPPGRLEVVQAPVTVVPGEPTAQILIVRVLDDMGQSTQGVPVRWEAAPGSGSLTQSADTSGLDGLASVEWTPGLDLGEQQVSVSIYDQSALQIRVPSRVFHADKIGAFYRNGCGLAGTAVWCWEQGSFYGPGATITRVLPQISVADLAVTSGYVCVLDAPGTTYCHANFGAAPPESHVTPAGLPPIRSISGSGTTFCGLAIADQTPWCWKQQDLVPVQVSASLQLSSVSAGASESCGLTATGTAWCWVSPGGPPVMVTGAHEFRAISVGSFSTCAIEAPAVLYCWNGIGNTPVAMPGVSAGLVSIGTFNEGLVAASSNATVFSLTAFETLWLTLETGVLPLPTREVSDHCALVFDGAVYCALPANFSNSFGPYTWVGIPEPAQ